MNFFALFCRGKSFVKYPGEKLLIEAEVRGSAILSMKAVRENKNPEKTIELEFNQNTEGRNHKMMMLKTKNPFDAKFEYSALMYTVGNDKWIKTTILPVPPKFSGYETWNNIIITPVLSDWKFTN